MANGNYSETPMNGKLRCLIVSGICTIRQIRLKYLQIHQLGAYAKHLSWGALSALGKSFIALTQGLIDGCKNMIMNGLKKSCPHRHRINLDNYNYLNKLSCLCDRFYIFSFLLQTLKIGTFGQLQSYANQG